MAGKLFDLNPANQSLGQLGNFVASDAKGGAFSKLDADDKGSLAKSLQPPPGGGDIDVRVEYCWTLSNIIDVDTEEIPYIDLVEYKINSSGMSRAVAQAGGVLKAGLNALGIGGGQQGTLAPYKELWPKNNPTGYRYRFPFFSDYSYELSTPMWEPTQTLGETAAAAGRALGGEKTVEKAQAAGNIFKAGMEAFGGGKTVGITDKPRVFTGHNDRSVTIQFTLFNTRSEADYTKNRNLAFLLMNQNLFNKQDQVTGLPPVFYDIYIPGQYFCYAACLTDLKVKNLGNQRLLNEIIIPDAFEFNLTFGELVKPSKNQFQAIIDGQAQGNIETSLKGALNAAKSALGL